jgi:hypothetical protein
MGDGEIPGRPYRLRWWWRLRVSYPFLKVLSRSSPLPSSILLPVENLNRVGEAVAPSVLCPSWRRCLGWMCAAMRSGGLRGRCGPGCLGSDEFGDVVLPMLLVGPLALL